MFRIRDRQIIDSVRQELLPPPPGYTVPADSADTPLRRWVELLGALTYLSVTRLPGADKERIWAELERAESQKKYRGAPEKNAALDALDRAQMLTCIYS